tara:strand:+ start:4586 stop:4744 length:159 start_codon:yes stop_codon:yes gene_type:complete
MNYFSNFLKSTDHLPYVVGSYLTVFIILLIIFILSLKRAKNLEKDFQDLVKK